MWRSSRLEVICYEVFLRFSLWATEILDYGVSNKKKTFIDSDIKIEKLNWIISNFTVKVSRNRLYKHCTALLILAIYF